MILSEYVEVKPTPQTVKHYVDLGYEIPMKRATELTKKVTHKEYVYDFSKTIWVKPTHLTRCCETEIVVLCDMCKENTMLVPYVNYNSVMERTGSYVCRDCAYKKVKQTVNDKYNVDNVFQLNDVKEKVRETMIERYNVPYALQSEEGQRRREETCIERFGVSHAMQCDQIKERAAKTYYANGSVATSKQQLYIHSLYGGELNYPISYYATDICLLSEKIVIEYDGGFHDGRVRLGQLTQDEFVQKEIVRSAVIKREGYKQIRIISSKDLLPFDHILLQMLSEAKQYFSLYPNHSWIEFNIDTSTVRNAEHKDGIPYSFGELRKIKDSDLPNNNNTNLKGA